MAVHKHADNGLEVVTACVTFASSWIFSFHLFPQAQSIPQSPFIGWEPGQGSLPTIYQSLALTFFSRPAQNSTSHTGP